MKRLAIIALMLNVGAAATYAQQHGSKTALSGTAAASTIDLGTGTPTTEYNLEGNSSLGSFTFRTVSSGAAPSQAPSSCSGGNKLYIPIAAGMGVLRSSDGSLLRLRLTGGSDCIDFNAGKALCIRMYEVVGGTGRFQNAAEDGGKVTLTMTVAPVVPGELVFFAVTGEMTGIVSE